MRLAFWRRELSCQEQVELVTAYLERALPPRTYAAVERHLAACTECTEYVAQMRRTIALTGKLADEAVPPAVVDALLAALSEAREAREPRADGSTDGPAGEGDGTGRS